MCLVGTGSSGIGSGHVSPALGERELMTHQFCFLFFAWLFFSWGLFSLSVFCTSFPRVWVLWAFRFSGIDLPVIKRYGCLSNGLIFG